MSAPRASFGWESKKAALALSKHRRELLREFARGIDPAMTKSQALYELIDTALPLIKPVDYSLIDAQEVRAIAERSAAALERFATALAPLEGLIADEEQRRLPPAGGPLNPRDWINGALARLGVRPARLALTLAWRSTAAIERSVEMSFEVSRMQLDAQTYYAAAIPLPVLAIRALIATPLADISSATLTAGVVLACAAAAPGWACELRAAGPATRPPLHRFIC